MGNTFFDLHLHAFNLSHAGLLAFVNRFFLNNAITFKDVLDARFGKILSRVVFGPARSWWSAIGFLRTAVRIAILAAVLTVVGLVCICLAALALSLFSGFGAIGLRDGQNAALAGIAIGAIGVMSAASLLAWHVCRKPVRTRLRRTVNVLSVFENDLAWQLRYLELDYLSLADPVEIGRICDDLAKDRDVDKFELRLKIVWEKVGKRFPLNGKEFDGVVLTPLMMDFGFKDFQGLAPNSIHYHLPPRKPIVEQSVDLFSGIQRYCRESPVGLFKIYPFLGLDPKNYRLPGETRGKEKSMQEMLERYFSDFRRESAAQRRERLEKGMNKLVDSACPGSTDAWYFAGIKVYPPLGFDPWPQNSDECSKVRWLYEFCSNKCIPITTHCGEGGFVVETRRKAWENTNPEKWRPVLKEFAQLKLNFAHAGNQSQSGGRAWLETILDLQAHHPNIYFDISCNGVRPSYYAELCARLREACAKKCLQVADVSARILFGTDFMVNLFDIDSYPDYLRLFSATQGFQPYFNKNDFCTVNAERFLFGP